MNVSVDSWGSTENLYILDVKITRFICALSKKFKLVQNGKSFQPKNEINFGIRNSCSTNNKVIEFTTQKGKHMLRTYATNSSEHYIAEQIQNKQKHGKQATNGFGMETRDTEIERKRKFLAIELYISFVGSYRYTDTHTRTFWLLCSYHQFMHV